MDPLAGIRVLDFGSFITAPYAAMMLAELGADVIKVERPSAGDPFRGFADGRYSPQFQAHNRHKRSLVLDYAGDAGRAVLRRMLPAVDVVLINTRPGVAARIGLDYESVRAINGRIVHCSITGFGESGPYAMRPAFDNVGQALSGWMSRFRTNDDARVVGPAVSDAATGMHAAMGMIAALYRRTVTGQGAQVEVNMIESTIALGVEPLTQHLATGGEVPVFQRAAMSQAYTLACADGKRIGLHLSSPDKFWRELCTAIGRPEWIADYPTRMDRVRAYEDLAGKLADVFKTRPRDEWVSLLQPHDVPFAPELSMQELQDDPQVRHLDVLHELQHPRYGTVRSIRRPVRIDGQRGQQVRPPPDLGEHSAQVLTEMGFQSEEIAALARSGVVAVNEGND
ncbi:CoA transferase [Ramlibacter sp. AW1]|uniref:CoA transferase n=1 Tax=Ramlibacter aurantiacus TaxID=2801330 RepID=A0A936ZUM9_9BURK|nr:CaiB/BaiF CoA-transferase family protein [Ramlibacter aurantiacus]MBL0421470.1 CoA transferase [Ramlibacter aurantiacus]